MIEIKYYAGILPEALNSALSQLHNDIFNAEDDLNEKITNKNSVLTLIAFKENEIAGYKIGYKKMTPAFTVGWAVLKRIIEESVLLKN